MGLRPECEGIIIDFDCQFKAHLYYSRIFMILTAFAELLPQLLMDFSQKVLVGFGEYSMTLNQKYFACKCGNDEEFIWKTRHGKQTKIQGVYRWLELHQPQVQCIVLPQSEMDFQTACCKGISCSF